MSFKFFLQSYAPLFTITGSLISSATVAYIAYRLATRRERQSNKTQILSLYNYLSAYAEYIFGQYFLYENFLADCRPIAYSERADKYARLNAYKHDKINPHYGRYIFALKACFEQIGSDNILKLSALCNAPENMVFNYQFLNATLNLTLMQMHEFYMLDIDDISPFEDYINKQEPSWEKTQCKLGIAKVRSLEAQLKTEGIKKDNPQRYAELIKQRNALILEAMLKTAEDLRGNSLMLLAHICNLEKDIKKSGYIWGSILAVLEEKIPDAAPEETWENFMEAFERQQEAVQTLRRENFRLETLGRF